jgi:hypothetical protein
VRPAAVSDSASASILDPLLNNQTHATAENQNHLMDKSEVVQDPIFFFPWAKNNFSVGHKGQETTPGTFSKT